MVKMLDGCLQRAKVETLLVDIPVSYEKTIVFFKRFGFQPRAKKQQENKEDDEAKSKDDNKQTENITMACNIKLLRQTIQFKIKKDMKKSHSNNATSPQQSPVKK